MKTKGGKNWKGKCRVEKDMKEQQTGKDRYRERQETANWEGT